MHTAYRPCSTLGFVGYVECRSCRHVAFAANWPFRFGMHRFPWIWGPFLGLGCLGPIGCAGFDAKFCVSGLKCAEDCSSSAPSPLPKRSRCCRAQGLIHRLHQLDPIQGLATPVRYNEAAIVTFPEPAAVHQLCLEFVHFPSTSKLLEDRLRGCSRALRALSHIVDVLEPKGNKTCSEDALRSRYQMDAKIEAHYSVLLGTRFWPPFQKYYQLISRWRVFAMLSNHSKHCRGLGYSCSLFNPWEPDRCFKHHELVEQVLDKPCYAWPRFPPGPNPSRQATDWLGIQNDCGNLRHPKSQDQPELTRLFECWGLSFGPLPGEDYFESISLLQAVTTAKDEFVLVEAGSGMGYWSLKGAKLWRRRFATKACHVVLIDSGTSMASAAQHLQKNRIYELCNVSLYQAHATGGLLDRLLGHGQIDMLHVDIQKWEVTLVRESDLLEKCRHVHFGTHTRWLHRTLRSQLRAREFAIAFDYAPHSLQRTNYGPVAFADGLLAASRVDSIQGADDFDGTMTG